MPLTIVSPCYSLHSFIPVTAGCARTSAGAGDAAASEARVGDAAGDPAGDAGGLGERRRIPAQALLGRQEEV